MGIFKVVLEQLQSNFEAVEVPARGKNPPYGIDKDFLLANFGDPIENRFSTLRNSFSGSLEYHNNTLNTLRELMVVKKPSDTSKVITLYQIIFSILYLCFLIAAFYLASKTNWWLFDLLAQYKNLRKEEIELHKVILSHRLWYLKKFKLDEPMMVSSYMKTTYSIQNNETMALLQINKDQQSTNQTRRSTQMRFNFTFKSTLTMVFLSIFSLVFVAFYGTVAYLDNSSFKKAHRMIIFYTETYEKVTNSYHFYLCTSLFMTFGNFIKINGVDPYNVISSKVETLPMLSLIQYLVNQRSDLQTFFGGSYGREIDELIFSNLCAQLDKTQDSYASDLVICKSNQYASNGLIAFLYHQREVLGEQLDLAEGIPSFLVNSRTDWNIFPFTEYLYSPLKASFRIVTRIVYGATYGKILPAGKSSIEAELANLSRLLLVLNRIAPPITIILFISIYIYFIFRTLIKDISICAESLFNILPDVMSQNKVIYRKFNEAYSTKY